VTRADATRVFSTCGIPEQQLCKVESLCINPGEPTSIDLERACEGPPPPSASLDKEPSQYDATTGVLLVTASMFDFLLMFFAVRLSLLHPHFLRVAEV
jgi:hypothetical protein